MIAVHILNTNAVHYYYSYCTKHKYTLQNSQSDINLLMIKEKDYIKELKFLINFDKNFLPCFQRLNYIQGGPK